MILRIRVILNVEEDVLRDIEVDGSLSMMEFHKAISSFFGFDSSEPSTFFKSNNKWEREDEIKIFKLDENDQVYPDSSVSEFIKSKGDKLIYIYDFLNYWTFFVELYEVDELSNSDSKFECINSVGDVPKEAPSDIYNNTEKANNFDQDENLDL